MRLLPSCAAFAGSDVRAVVRADCDGHGLRLSTEGVRVRERREWRIPATKAAAIAATIAMLFGAADARAFAWFDGKLELHGFVAQQIRTLANDLDPEEEFDLAQWYNVLDLELEAKPFPRGIGPLEIVEFYVRGEARYDCLWTRGCGIFPSVDTYGNRADHLPPRLIDARLSGRAGTLKTNDRCFYSNMDRETLPLDARGNTRNFSQTPLTFDRLPGLVSPASTRTSASRSWPGIAARASRTKRS
jgi:hypothetical protein